MSVVHRAPPAHITCPGSMIDFGTSCMFLTISSGVIVPFRSCLANSLGMTVWSTGGASGKAPFFLT
eukprot:CAMPEP_0177732278 /NCGR_PEP_ID=MMETSP0484_2-20121128/23021_1 /TAXON_ID=354590 /ORGANISM="Rhodomonas lens, Strain RHODO" /LENGTH=65 /DNA_ID=CAMNT_0019245491 /DNA_START=229 /DNA_END=422 /DNA_ORIENTATION=-